MAGDRLFMGLPVYEVQHRCSEAAARAVQQLSDEQLAGSGIEDLTDAILAEKVPPLIELDTAGHGLTTEVVKRPESRGLSAMHLASGQLPAREYLQAHLHIPYTGTQQSLSYRPATQPGHPPEAVVTGSEVILTVPAVGMGALGVEEQLLGQERNLVAWVEALNSSLRAVQRHVRSLVTNGLQERLALRAQRDELAAALTIPVRQVESARALPVPVRRVNAAVTRTPAGAGQPPGWELADAVYEEVIRTIISFCHAMERRPASAGHLIPDEETLRDWMLFLLNANYEGPGGADIFAGGETENGAGKTDILVRHAGANAFIGECKFWHGPAKFRQAIDQLLGYTVWRDSKAAIVLFITQRDATRAIDAAGNCLTAHAQCRQTRVPADPARRRDYVFASPLDEYRHLSLALLPVVVRTAA